MPETITVQSAKTGRRYDIQLASPYSPADDALIDREIARLDGQSSSYRPSQLGTALAQSKGLPPPGVPASGRGIAADVRAKLNPQKMWTPKPVPPAPPQPRTLVEMADYPAKLKKWQDQKAKIDRENLAVMERAMPATAVSVQAGSPFREDPQIAQTALETARKAREGFDPWKAVQEKILPGLQQGVGGIAAPGTRAITDPEVRRAAQRGIGSLIGAPGSAEELVFNASIGLGLKFAAPALKALAKASKQGLKAFDAAVDALEITGSQKAQFKAEYRAKEIVQRNEARAAARKTGQKPHTNAKPGSPAVIDQTLESEKKYIAQNWQKIVKQDIEDMERRLKSPDVSQNHKRQLKPLLAEAKRALASGEAPTGVADKLRKDFRATLAPHERGGPAAEPPKTAQKAPKVEIGQPKEAPPPAPKTPEAPQKIAAPPSRPEEIEVHLGRESQAKYEVTDVERELMGVKDRLPTERKSLEETWANARKGYNSEKAQRLAKWGDRSQPLNDEQTAALVIRKIELIQEHEALKEALKKSPDPFTLERMEEVEKMFDEAATALDRSGKEWGRSGRARRLEISEDFSELTITRRAEAQAQKIGKGLSQKDAAGFRKLIGSEAEGSGLRGVEKDIRKTEKELAKERASVTLAKNRGQIFDTAELDKERDALLKQLREAPLMASLVPAEQLIIAGKLAVNLAKRGVNSIDDILREIKKHLPGATDDDIIDAFNAEANIPRTKKEVSEELRSAKAKFAALKREGRYDQKLRADVQKYESQLKSGAYRLESKAEREISDRLLLLKAHRDNLKKEIQFRIAQQGRTRARKIAEEASAFPKAAMSIADMSATLRQGLLLAAGNPMKAAIAFGRASRAVLDPKFAARFEAGLREGPLAAARQRAGLYLADQGVAIGKREEAFLSHLAEKIPIYGSVVRASERHFNTYLNSLRADVFDSTYRSVGNMTADESRALARFINIGTGRGEIEGLGKAANAMQHLFFSPRLVAARIQSPADALGLTGRGREIWRSRGARRQMIQSWTSLLTTGMTTLQILEANGAKVTWDPSSPDFGKAVFGNTRVDIWGGFQQPIRLLASIVKKSYQASRDELKGQELLSQVGKDVVQFLRYKFSPGVNLGSELLTRESAVGRKTTREGSLLSAVTPLLTQDFIEALNDPKTPKERAVAGLAASFFGIGVSTYDKSESRRK